MWMVRGLVVGMVVTWVGAAPQSPDYTDYKLNQVAAYDEYPVSN